MQIIGQSSYTIVLQWLQWVLALAISPISVFICTHRQRPSRVRISSSDWPTGLTLTMLVPPLPLSLARRCRFSMMELSPLSRLQTIPIRWSPCRTLSSMAVPIWHCRLSMMAMSTCRFILSSISQPRTTNGPSIWAVSTPACISMLWVPTLTSSSVVIPPIPVHGSSSMKH